MGRLRGIGAVGAVLCALVAAQAAPASALEGEVWDAGSNDSGQLASGNFENRLLATPVSGLSEVVSVVGHERGGLALLANGTVEAWGANDAGQLGNGTFGGTSLVPAPVSGLSEVTAIAAHGRFCLALLSNGTVMAWGANEHGQLGDGSTENRDLPVPVGGLTEVAKIAAGQTHSLALLGSGEVRAWGANADGELGNATNVDSDVPVPVSGLSGVTAIAAGGRFSLALSSVGAVSSWGANEVGELGNGSTTSANTPGSVSGLTSGITAIAAGADHALALRSAGTVISWGDNTNGQLGNGGAGSGVHSTTPQNVLNLSGVSAISAGTRHSLALLSSGTVFGWGHNEEGELGIGGGISRSDEPVRMCGLMKVSGISAAYFASYAYGVTSTLPCPTVTGISPELGPQGGGTTVTITGTHFDETTAVLFGKESTSEFVIESPTQITAVTPPENPPIPSENHFQKVYVETPAGRSPYSIEFQYMPPPIVTKVAPKKGPASGGTTVTISGKNFLREETSVVGVKFGSVDAASFEVKTIKHAPTIVAVSPSAEGGTADITVETQWGTSATSKADQFKFAPVVSEVSPPTGSKAGGYSVTIHGFGFAPGTNLTTFKFGSSKAKSVNCASLTECTVLVPSHPAGTVDVKATVNKSAGAVNAPADHFTYE
jgi:alpha-tubulin suppressor-like RCC1 family protein